MLRLWNKARQDSSALRATLAAGLDASDCSCSVVPSPPRPATSTDGGMHSDLTEIWRVIDADPSVSAVLLTGAGKAFSAGGDLDLLDQMIADFDTRMRVWKEARDMVYNLINCSKPVVAAINGAAVGAGLALAILADISIASASAR